MPVSTAPNSAAVHHLHVPWLATPGYNCIYVRIAIHTAQGSDAMHAAIHAAQGSEAMHAAIHAAQGSEAMHAAIHAAKGSEAISVHVCHRVQLPAVSVCHRLYIRGVPFIMQLWLSIRVSEVEHSKFWTFVFWVNLLSNSICCNILLGGPYGL